MAERTPLVSVNIAAFNAERFICETLECVLRQTYDPFEVIVIDDGSTDRTPDLVRWYAERDQRVHLHTQRNMGVSAAKNAALERSHGELIAPLDADDIWHPEKLSKQVDCMLKAGPRSGVVYAWSVYINEAGSLTGGFSASAEEGDVYLKLLYYNFLGTGSVPLIRRSCLSECGPYRLEFAGLEDKELFMRIAERYEYKVVPEFLVGYRIVRGSTSHGHARLVDRHRALLREVQERYPEVPPFVYRWSRGIVYSFAASRSLRSRHLKATVRYLLFAMWNDPSVGLHIIKRILARRRFRSQLVGPTNREMTFPLFASNVTAAGNRGTRESAHERARALYTSPFGDSRRRLLHFLEATRLHAG